MSNQNTVTLTAEQELASIKAKLAAQEKELEYLRAMREANVKVRERVTQKGLHVIELDTGDRYPASHTVEKWLWYADNIKYALDFIRRKS